MKFAPLYRDRFHIFKLAVISLLCVGAWAAFGCTRARAAEPQYLHINTHSAVLTSFWGQPVSVDAHILLPDSYYKEPRRRYPIMYWIQGFTALGDIDLDDQLIWQDPMRRLKREFIVVFLNGMFNWSHQEFADSANDGPWGTALTTEFIPETESRFRAIGTPQTRFVGGHSSGGWSALWLQVTYPDLFGGEWSLAPDPVDFRNFSGPDLTRTPPQNFFNDPQGHFYTIDGKPLRWFVVGPGWEQHQFESFDTVFSPKGGDGKPEPLFDRKTGTIDPAVAAYWETHYDISRILGDHWSTLASHLRGKLHIFVGDADNFRLNEPVQLLQERLTKLGSDAEVVVAPGLNHFTIFSLNGDAIGYIMREANASLAQSGAAALR